MSDQTSAAGDALLRDEVKRLRLIAARLYDVATFALPHIYEGMCPDQQQPDERDPSCPACYALLDGDDR